MVVVVRTRTAAPRTGLPLGGGGMRPGRMRRRWTRARRSLTCSSTSSSKRGGGGTVEVEVEVEDEDEEVEKDGGAEEEEDMCATLVVEVESEERRGMVARVDDVEDLLLVKDGTSAGK